MPKPPTIWLILAVAFVAAATLGIASAWQSRSGDDGTAAHTVHGDPRDVARRQDELRFLKGAFDRLEAEAKQNPSSPALRSLRTEQDAVVLRMREVARPLPPDGLPEELRGLLGSGPTATTAAPVEKAARDAPPTPATPGSHAAIGAAPAGELKPGLVSAAPGLPLVLSRDPALSGVVLIARPRPPRPAPETAAERPGERPPVNIDPGAAAAETKSPAKPQITVRAPERVPPANISGTAERPASGPVAILGR